MSTVNYSKLNNLLSSTPDGVVLLTSWLREQGYSPELIKRYRSSGWLKSIGVGANIRARDSVNCYGALYALQNQCGSSIHVGGRTALALLGSSQYLELNPKRIVLFASGNDKRLPLWFKNFDWGIEPKLHSSDFLPPDFDLEDFSVKGFAIKISGKIRAIMECLYLAPHHQEVVECYELMEFMYNLHPKYVQEALEKCNSIKVKRLFLYLAEKANHPWLKYLDMHRIDLGSGNRKIVSGGFLDKKYQITVPKCWRENGLL